jgi:hypothetical protein
MSLYELHALMFRVKCGGFYRGSNESPIFGLGEIDTWVIGAIMFLLYVFCVNL